MAIWRKRLAISEIPTPSEILHTEAWKRQGPWYAHANFFHFLRKLRRWCTFGHLSRSKRAGRHKHNLLLGNDYVRKGLSKLTAA
jgi:hypothetical protein